MCTVRMSVLGCVAREYGYHVLCGGSLFINTQVACSYKGYGAKYFLFITFRNSVLSFINLHMSFIESPRTN